LQTQLDPGFVWPALSTGLQSQPNLAVRIISTLPISVIATNIEKLSLSADRYIVPPISMLGNSYSFALDATGDNNQFNMVYVLPLDANPVDVTFLVRHFFSSHAYPLTFF
jgi:hypothetical protein